MDIIKFLTTRQSNPLLTTPAPASEQIEQILSAGMRVPDHAGLTPWHFDVVAGAGLDKLSLIFGEAVEITGGDDTKIQKAKNMPYRAPLIIVVSTRYQPHDKVPEIEQSIAAGCAVHAMQMAATALGYGAMWRTGAMSYDANVKMALNIEAHNDIVGFLYIGTMQKQLPVKPSRAFAPHVSYLR
ncbi:NAD(P)H nitroreductase [Thalassotalea fusca]